jgi:tetratricopeptide (TPR) repeat protein
MGDSEFPVSSLGGSADAVVLRLERGRNAASTGDHAHARDLLTQVLGDAAALPAGPTRSRLVAQACLDLADVHVALGDYAVAGEFLTDALNRARAELGDQDPDTASAWNSLGMWHRYRGAVSDAAQAYEEAGRILESNGSNADLAAVLHNRASLAHLTGDLSTAETLINDAISLRSDVDETIDDLGVLAVVLADQDHFDAAQGVYDRARSLINDRRGPDDPELVYLAANEAVLSYRRGRPNEAERRYRQAIAESDRLLGPDHPHTGEVLANVAALYESLNDQDEAHRTAARAISILAPCVDPSHPSLRLAQEVLEATRPSTVATAE